MESTSDFYLNYIVNEIHRTIVAMVDDEGLPVTAAIDMMDTDGDSLFFLTAKDEEETFSHVDTHFVSLFVKAWGDGEAGRRTVMVMLQETIKLNNSKVNATLKEMVPLWDTTWSLTMMRIYPCLCFSLSVCLPLSLSSPISVSMMSVCIPV
jgi:hypothetical protein